jgi:hypothetical protein
MRTLAKVLSVSAALAALLATSGAAAHAPTPKHPRCSAAGGHLIRVTAKVVVYERLTNRQDGDGSHEDGVYACSRPSGRSYLLGYDDVEGQSSEYGPETSLVAVKIAGRFVVAQFVTGADEAAACSKYNGPGPPPCPEPTTTIHIAAADSGRAASIALRTADGAAAIVAISSAGALAWVDGGLFATHLEASGARSLTHRPTMLDPGPVDSGSLTASGLNVSWVSGGTSHSSALS